MKNKLTILLMLFTIITPSLAVADIITSVDVMKYTKDNLNNQFSNAQIDSVVSLIMKEVKPKYISIAVPLDDSSGYAERWASSIHAHGAGVIFRGTWSGIEGIYDFPKLVGPNRIPADTWLDKTRQYILDHPKLFATGDIWAVLPERTEGIFQDQTSFLTYEGGIQSNYAKFFIDLNKVSSEAFAKIGKNVKVGYTANNFSEIASSWMPTSLYGGQDSISVDHYGITHTPQEMENDLRTASKKYGKPIFLQEWGDYWNSGLTESYRTAYLEQMYAVFKKLADEKILVGFNYWGGWVNNAEGIFTQTNGSYSLNYRGKLLANFFASFNTQRAVVNPVPPPAPITTPTPTPVVSVTPTPVPAPARTNPPVPKPTPAPVVASPVPIPEPTISTDPELPRGDYTQNILGELSNHAIASTGGTQTQTTSPKTISDVIVYLVGGTLTGLFVLVARRRFR